MNSLALGRRVAGVFVAVVLFSSVASISFHPRSTGDSAFESFVDTITGNSIQEARAENGNAENGQDKGPGKGKGKNFKVDDSATPFQKGLKQEIENRGQQGKGRPQATFEETEFSQNDTKIVIKGKGKLKFDNPGQAGKARWDDYIVENDNSTHDNVNKNGTIVPGNYTDLVIQKINEKVLQKALEQENATGMNSTIHHVFIHDDDGDGKIDEDPVDGVDNDGDGKIDEDPAGDVEFGFEKREIEIEEIYELTFQDEEDATVAFALIISDQDPMMTATELMGLAGTSSSTDKVLMGFTFAPPAIDWTIGTKEVVCVDLLFDEFCFTAFEARAGFFLEYGIGLRLPAQVTMTTVDSLVEDHPYQVATSLQPLNFNSVDYSSMGVAPFGGNEFAAFLEFFLGVRVVIVEVTVIDWALETDIDLAEMCTEFTHEHDHIEDVDCGDFVTPFGIDPATGEQREFPVPAVELPADKTGLKMSFAGATLGIALKVDPTFGSGSITADWSAAGDASGSGSIEYTKSADNAGSIVEFGPVQAANFSPGTDNAEIHLDNFSYHLDTMQITLSAAIDLGGWLSFVPDLPFFELITIDLGSLGFPELSLGQHSGTDGALHQVFVEHYGIDVEVSPETLDVEPGFFGNYTVTVSSKSNVPDTFDSFSVTGLPDTWENVFENTAVSLGPSQSTSFEVAIKPLRNFGTAPGPYHFTVHGASEGAKVHDLTRADADTDTVNVLPFYEVDIEVAPEIVAIEPGFFGYYTMTVTNLGNTPDRFSTFAVSGLPDTWEKSFEKDLVSLDPGEPTSFEVGINPLRHFTTTPGNYTFIVSGASEEGELHGSVTGTDSDTDVINVLSFSEPHLSISPLFKAELPGDPAIYLITIENFGNAPDKIALDIDLLDFGQNYRALPSAIQQSWTDIGATEFGPIDPAHSENTEFTIIVPSTWEGIENTIYNFTGTATGEIDPDEAVFEIAGLGVNATKESMSRYIDFEIAQLIAAVEESPVNEELKADLIEQLLAAKQKNLQALDHILADRFRQANNMLESSENIMSAFVSHVDAQNGKGIPEELAEEWMKAGTTIGQDLQTAIAHPF